MQVADGPDAGFEEAVGGDFADAPDAGDGERGRGCGVYFVCYNDEAVGFLRSLASFARNLFGATPMEAVSAVRSRISALMRAAMAGGVAEIPRAPVTSRNASSTESCCTSGVKSPRIAIIWRLTSE